jgi:branched-chain amino acid transport system ATP-binding protein
VLRLTSVEASYGRVKALRGVSLHVDEGEIVTLIGANGAGKSTILKTISGLVRADTGSISFDDEETNAWGPVQIVRVGLCQVPEGRQLFGTLSVADNLMLGAYVRRARSSKREIVADIEEQYERFPLLADRRNQHAGSLSGGEQQMLALARGLMSRPKMLLLDEPSLGLAPIIAREFFETVSKLREEGLTVLLVEQNARAALQIADRGYVLETGRIVLEGTAQDLLGNPEVQRAYLGKGYEEVWQ